MVSWLDERLEDPEFRKGFMEELSKSYRDDLDERDKRIAELERCLKTALEFVPKSVAKRLTVQGGLG